MLYENLAGQILHQDNSIARLHPSGGRLRRGAAVADRAIQKFGPMTVDDYAIADIATVGRANARREVYAADDILRLDGYPKVQAWLRAGPGRGLARSAMQRGRRNPAKPA